MCVKATRIAADKRVGPSAARVEAGASRRNEAKGQRCGVDDGGEVRDLADLRERAKAEVSKVVIGQDRTVELLLIAAVAHGHVLIEGPPGSAKTLLARAVAHMLGASFKRIQFTPDTTPTELNGQNVIRAGEHLFMPGAVFTNVLLADEINRTPPRTQAALFEPMGERQVTVDGKAHKLPDPFLVIATQNPHEHEGVFPLPEGQLDRFLFKIELDYADAESELVDAQPPAQGHRAGHARRGPPAARRRRPRQGTPGARAHRGAGVVGRYIVGRRSRTRELPGVELGVSSRAMIHLVMAVKANARLHGRERDDRGRPRDGPFVLRHRIAVAPGRAWTPCSWTRCRACPAAPPPVSPVG